MASPRSNKILIIFLSCIIHHTFFFVTKADQIDDVCSHVPAANAEICKTAFRADDRATKADRPALAQVAIDLALTHATSSVNFMNSMKKTANDPKLVEKFASCLEFYSDVSDSLKESADALKAKDYATMNIHASAALDGPANCDTGYSNPPPQEPEELKKLNKQVQALCSAIAYIANSLKGN